MINKAPSHVLNNSYSRNLDEWINNTNGSINPYQKSLDEWLNTTMKESPKPFSTSSTEFLDTNRAAAINGINSANAIMANAFRLIPELEVCILFRFVDFILRSRTNVTQFKFFCIKEYNAVWTKSKYIF